MIVNEINIDRVTLVEPKTHTPVSRYGYSVW